MTKFAVRKFTPDGVAAFRNWLDNRPQIFAEAESALLALINLTEDNEKTEVLGSDFDFINFPSRRALADHLWNIFGTEGKLRRYAGDTEVWAWMAAKYLTIVADRDTYSMIGSNYRWIPESTSTRNHRHLLQGPFIVMQSNYPAVDDAMAVLATPVLKPGEVVERIAGKAGLSRGVGMAVATALYFDPIKLSLKPGSSSKKSGSGGPQRLSTFLSQIELTVDYVGMSKDKVLHLLPAEFDRFK